MCIKWLVAQHAHQMTCRAEGPDRAWLASAAALCRLWNQIKFPFLSETIVGLMEQSHVCVTSVFSSQSAVLLLSPSNHPTLNSSRSLINRPPAPLNRTDTWNVIICCQTSTWVYFECWCAVCSVTECVLVLVKNKWESNENGCGP